MSATHDVNTCGCGTCARFRDVRDYRPSPPTAFPPSEYGSGMSLRDYFAAKALPWALARMDRGADAVRAAYDVADAMLAAREGKP